MTCFIFPKNPLSTRYNTMYQSFLGCPLAVSHGANTTCIRIRMVVILDYYLLIYALQLVYHTYRIINIASPMQIV